MNPLVAHIANGRVFFSGSAVLILCVLLRHWCGGPVIQRLSKLGIVTGVILSGLASMPFSVCFWIPPIGSLIRACIYKTRASHWWWIVVFVGIWSGGVLTAAISQRTPQLSTDKARQAVPVVVVADSLTAGLGENEATTWPRLLAGKHRQHVIDLSHVGETAASALNRIQQQEIPDEAVVLVEIGGNDLLGGTTPEEFEQSLNQLFRVLVAKERTVFLFELPLPPFHGRWCKIQRDVAACYGVSVIPRHQLTSIITGKTSTFDSVHLTQEGHDRMLKLVEFVLRTVE